MSQLTLPYSGHMILPALRVSVGIQFSSLNAHLIPGTNHRRHQRLRSLKTTIKSSNSNSFDLKTDKGMNAFYDIEFTVRDYETDQYGVVNNAVFANYCQHGRRELMEKIGSSFDTIAKTGNAIAVSETSLKYLGPLMVGDKFILRMRITDMTAVRLYIEHYIFKIPNEEPILKARATKVWLDGNYRPIRIPAEVRSKIAQFLHHDDSN